MLTRGLLLLDLALRALLQLFPPFLDLRALLQLFAPLLDLRALNWRLRARRFLAVAQGRCRQRLAALLRLCFPLTHDGWRCHRLRTGGPLDRWRRSPDSILAGPRPEVSRAAGCFAIPGVCAGTPAEGRYLYRNVKEPVYHECDPARASAPLSNNNTAAALEARGYATRYAYALGRCHCDLDVVLQDLPRRSLQPGAGDLVEAHRCRARDPSAVMVTVIISDGAVIISDGAVIIQ